MHRWVARAFCVAVSLRPKRAGAGFLGSFCGAQTWRQAKAIAIISKGGEQGVAVVRRAAAGFLGSFSGTQGEVSRAVYGAGAAQ